eukprot:TRINITY_DN167_c0_g1_i1.p1 TRINITY_DN167_c0_g1~~TRINITY_DN167_c0_g1_i1.p1  ORF type:complete len:598 (+),score=212.93 TRINITY_DN167_c0_g1_i1:84-1877(+)
MSNPWNAFQKANAGQGYSRSEMSAMYQASKSSGGGSSYSSYSSPSPSYSYSSPSRSSYASSSTPYGYGSSSGAANPWNAFQQQMKGQGYSRDEIQRLYHERKAGASTPARAPAATSTRSSTSASASSSSKGNAWNDFQRQHAGQGYSSSQLSEMYKASKPTSQASPAKTTAALAPETPRKSEPKTNTWNEFQKAHKGQGLKPAEMARMYRQQQQPRQALQVEQHHAEASAASPMPSSDFVDARIMAFLDRLETIGTSRPLFADDEPAQVPWQRHDIMDRYGSLDSYTQKAQVAHQERVASKQKMTSKHASLVEAARKDMGETLEIPEAELKYGQELGRGGFGVVFRAEWKKDVQVAVKVVESPGKSARKAFVQETKTMAKLEHDGIVKVYGWTTKGKGIGMVMEMMPEGSLFDLLQLESVELTKKDKLDLAKQVVGAVAYIHSDMDMAHRDLKPHNVLISSIESDGDRKYTAKLCDFGFVKVRNSVQASTMSTSTAVFVGTPAYASPELFEEKVEDDDMQAWKQCDCYALGMLLWELFEEDTPYFGSSAAGIKKLVLKGDRPEFTDETPEDVRKVIQGLWNADAKARSSAILALADL